MGWSKRGKRGFLGVDLRAIRGIWYDLWCLRKNFSMVKFLEGRTNYLRMSSDMKRFLEVLKLNLRDIVLVWGRFIWCGGQNFQSSLRLNHFLGSNDWKEHFSDLIQCVLPQLISDHSHVVFDGCGMQRGKSPFRIEKMLLKSKGFKYLVRN